MTDDVLLHAIAQMNRYRLATAGDAETAGIGVMTEARWQAFFETMSADGVYPAKPGLAARLLARLPPARARRNREPAISASIGWPRPSPTAPPHSGS
jgi:NitT/TauT family transport system substrate-binding protein